jgi:hypothetical protein
MPQTETGGTIRRTNGEGIGDRQIAARRPSKASRNRCCRSADQVLVNAPPQAPIIERDLLVVWANWFHPALAKRWPSVARPDRKLSYPSKYKDVGM